MKNPLGIFDGQSLARAKKNKRIDFLEGLVWRRIEKFERKFERES
jgi:hypothetical protein